MCKEDLIDIYEQPGIYMIQNNINNKCYIGQSINLHTRLLHHINNSINNRYNAPIYRAIKKYGIENFSVYILKTFDNPVTNETKKQLDIYEKKFINEYNSYGCTGYNQTKGGDGGIDGYKFTKEQKLTISKNSFKIQNDGRNTIYCYDVKNNKFIESTSLQELKRQLNVNFRTGCIRNLLIYNQYILSRTKDDLLIKIKKYKDKIQLYNTNGCSKFTFQMKEDILNNISEKEFLSKYNVCKSTYYHYKEKLNIS